MAAARAKLFLAAALAALTLTPPLPALAMHEAPARLGLGAPLCLQEGGDQPVKHASGSGLFLQRDPAGFLDSVNVFAGLANDPINNRDPTGRALPLLGAAYGLYLAYGVAATQAICFGAGFIDESGGMDICPVTPADQLGRATKLAGRASVRAGAMLVDASVQALARSRTAIVAQLGVRVRQLELAQDAARGELDLAKGAVGVALEQAGKKVSASLDHAIDLVVNAVPTSVKGRIPPPPVGNIAGLARSIINDAKMNSATKQVVGDLRNLTREQVAEVKRLVEAGLPNGSKKPIIYLE